jgi:hypothetical protein
MDVQARGEAFSLKKDYLPDDDVGCDLSPVRGLATPCRMSAGSSDCHLADKKRTLETLPIAI